MIFLKGLGCLFVLFFAVVIVIAAFVLRIYHTLKSKINNSPFGKSGNNNTNGDFSDDANTPDDVDATTGKKKIFPKNEGEYVDYEEVD